MGEQSFVIHVEKNNNSRSEKHQIFKVFLPILIINHKRQERLLELFES